MGKADVTKIKVFASKMVDSARPAWGRSRVDRPKRGIFVATTNEETYLRDTTGNRRFWPVELEGKIDLDGVARDRDQLWAEAAVLEASGEPLVIPEALWGDAAVEQQARMELDPWEDAIAPRLALLCRKRETVSGRFAVGADDRGDPEFRVSTDYLLSEVVGLPKERQLPAHTKRLVGVIRGLGWERREATMRIGGAVVRGYVKGVTEENVV
jgi:hypothetical protein